MSDTTSPPPEEHEDTEKVSRNKDRVEHIVQLVLQLIMVVGAGWAIYRGEYLTAFLIVVAMVATAVPTVLKDIDMLYLPAEVSIVTILFIFAALFLGEMQTFYEKIWWWDLALHTVSGLMMAYVGFIIILAANRHSQVQLNLRPAMIAVATIVFTLACGALWEIIEFTLDHAIGTEMQDDNWDTMTDLLVELAAAIVVSVVGAVRLHAGKGTIVVPLIMRFLGKNPDMLKDDEAKDKEDEGEDATG